jgi:ubiquinone/menaquinone biosynthesis C-methylase UbiE
MSLLSDSHFVPLQQGVTPLATIVRGDFLNMPFQPNTFDAAYAIEATCHAPKVRDVQNKYGLLQ